jgi:hypothetical protein
VQKKKESLERIEEDGFVENLDKDWFGLVVDTGNFQTNNAYEEIILVAYYAVFWQV